MLDRVAGGRGHEHDGQHEHLIETQLGNVLAEIEAGCAADAVNAVAVVDGIEIQLQNALLPELTLQCQRDHKLHCLSQKGLREAQVQVLGELLGDGAAAADDPPCPEILFTGSSDVVHVVSAMGVEGSVLLPQDQFDLQRGYPGQGLKVRLCPARLIQGERRPLSHQKKSIARYPDAACQDCREQDTDCLHHPSPIFVASVSTQAGRNPHLSATFCDRIFAAAVP